MANSYFKFKQFTIHQNKCAMKVCTDACLFGALTAEEKMRTINCLDIGTGTGLLSLMVAQKNSASIIDAIEIDAAAATQAMENINASPWADRIQVHHQDILTFKPNKLYGYIFSNPPFFEGDLQSPDKTKNNAKHNTSLTLKQLLKFVTAHLKPTGLFTVLLPYLRVDYFIEEAEKAGLHLTKKVLVKQTLKHKFFRGILVFERKEKKLQYNEIFIKDSNHNYTPEFTTLLKDYYLFL